jgi:hypothetical protein
MTNAISFPLFRITPLFLFLNHPYTPLFISRRFALLCGVVKLCYSLSSRHPNIGTMCHDVIYLLCVRVG